jgi:hypothetical protein
MTRKRPAVEDSRDLAMSDEVAALTAGALMELALSFEATHYAQIRRHYQSMMPEPDQDPRQLELFPEHFRGRPR